MVARSIPPVFSTERMVAEYDERAYRRLAADGARLAEGGNAPLRARVAERTRVAKGFAEVRFLSAHVSNLEDLHVGDRVEGRVEIELGPLSPADVLVELVLGHRSGDDDLRLAQVVRLMPTERSAEARALCFEGSQPLTRSGTFAYGFRVRARGAAGDAQAALEQILWA